MPHNSPQPEPRVSPLWWLWLPLLVLALVVGIYLADRSVFIQWIDGELGAIELGTVLILIPGVIYAAMIWPQRQPLPNKWLPLWFVLVGLGCFYFAGEEASWGQHLLGWQTPEGLNEINDQHETNLHNISSWLDQKPRLLLELWVIIGGLLLPLIRKIRGAASRSAADWGYWFWPSRLLIPTALIAFLVKLPEKLNDWFDVPRPPPFDMRVSELQEFYFGLFLTLYLISVYLRLRALRRAGPAQD